MKQTINIYDFERAFELMNRKENFSYDGLKALFEFLEDYEESCETEIELDVIDICCEYTEYDNIKEYLDYYKPTEIITFEEWKKEDKEINKEYSEYIEDIKDEVEEYLQDNTQLIKLTNDLNDGFIIQCY